MPNTKLEKNESFPDLSVWDFEKCLNSERADSNQKEEGLLLRTLTGHGGLVHNIFATSFGLISCDITGLIFERDFWKCIQEGPSIRILKCEVGINCMTCDSDHIICGLLNKELAVFDRKSLNLVQNLSGHTDHIWSIDMTEKLIISGSWDSTVKLWSKKDWKILDSYSHPDQKEISGVKFSLSDNFVYVSCLSGALTILKLEEQQSLSLAKIIRCHQEFGEIYSLALDKNYLLTGHTLTTTCVQVWNISGDDLLPCSTMREYSSESIIWNIHLDFPLALVCRDNELLDIYHLESHSCLKSLKHESKVLNATLHKGIIVVGCQYGLLVFWHLKQALEANEVVIDINHSCCLKILSEHSGAIANVHVDNEELITDDYDGVVIFRNLKTHSEIKDLF